MSDSRNDKSQNNIPEEEPLGGFYDEEEEKKKSESAKDFARDIRDDVLDAKDNIDNIKDIVKKMQNSATESSSSSDESGKSNEWESNDSNLKSEDSSLNTSQNSANATGNEAGGIKGTGESVGSGSEEFGPTGGSGGTSGVGTTGGSGGTSGVGTTGGAGAGGGAGATGVGGGAGTTGTAVGTATETGTAVGTSTTSAGAAVLAPAIPIIIIVIIIIIFVIGLIGFFTVMPGLIIGKLKSFGLSIAGKIKGFTTGNSKIVTQDDIQSVAQYIQNLGYDIQTYGFADVKYKKKTKKELEDNDVKQTREIKKIIPVNNDKGNDYLTAYISADAQTYVSAQFSLWGALQSAWDNLTSAEDKSIDQESKGLINIVNNGGEVYTNDDVVQNAENYAKVDTKKRKLYIYSNAIDFLIYKHRYGKVYSYDLEDWTAMYGRPLELFIALHTSTMMPDLSQQIATNKKFNTKVNIELINTQMDYDVELNDKDGNKIKFSHDSEKYPDPNEPAIQNMNKFIDFFLKNGVNPSSRSTYDDILNAIEDSVNDNPEAKFKFFQGMWQAGKDAGVWWNFTHQFNYVNVAENIISGEYDFESVRDIGNATMAKNPGTFTVDGVSFSGTQCLELARLIANGIANQTMYYPVIRDVTNHWFYGTIDFMGTSGKVTHGAYRRARVVEKRIKYAADDNTTDKAQADTSDQTNGFDEDYLDMNSLTQQVIDDYKTVTASMKEDAKAKAKSNPAGQPVANSSVAIKIPDANSAPDSAEVQNELATRISFRERQVTRAENILNNNVNADQDEDSIDKRFDIYLNTRMSSKDGNGGVFYQAAEPELLGPSDDIKKVFSGSYYQYDGTAETAKKIAAAKSIDKGKTTYIYDGDEYDISQEEIDEKQEAEKARKDGDLDSDYYLSPMAKKKVDFTKNQKLALQALAMLDSMKTHAGDEAYKNLKELFYSLKYFTEEQLTTREKQVLLWIADNGERGEVRNWNAEVQAQNNQNKSKEKSEKDKTEYKLILKNLNQDNMKIVAPDDATASYSDGILKLTFTQMSEDTYKILNYRYNGLKNVDDKSYTGSFTKIDKDLLTGYTMYIKGVKDPGKTEFKRGDTIADVATGMTDFGNEDNGKIEIVFHNEEGSPHDSIEEYMNSNYTKTDEENLKKQKEIEETKSGYVYSGSASIFGGIIGGNYSGPLPTGTGFELIFNYILQAEGGYTNDKDDHGGKTTWGIKEKEARSHGYTGDMRDLTQDFVKDIYLTDYYLANNLDKIKDERVALTIFDVSVHYGIGRGIKFARRALKNMGVNIEENTKANQEFLDAVNSVDPLQFCNTYSQIQRNGYNRIVENDPTQRKYLKGWMGRVDRKDAFIRNMQATSSTSTNQSEGTQNEATTTG